MNELAADAIRAVTVGCKFLAELGLIVEGNVSLHHKVCLIVGKGALKVRLVNSSKLDKNCGRYNSGIL